MSDVQHQHEMTDREKADFVLAVYFRTQAAIERYMGREQLPTWTEHVAQINANAAAKRLPRRIDRARSILGGLNSMLEVYGSDKSLSEQEGEVRLDVHQCGIWDYRERAQQQGVELTLPTPCEFCVDLHRRTAAHLGVVVSNELGHRGCRWVVQLPDAEPSGE